MASSNGYVPSTQAQLGYIGQWFHEWSEMQRNDFLPILAQKFGTKGYVNGLLPGLEALNSFEDRPPSLFQCRIKLFREWSDNWSQVEKEQLLSRIKSMDPDFLQKYEKELMSDVKTSDIHSVLNDEREEVE
uniref:Uncharacterized protein n=1 Tax=Clastoptera arizonana TaxID=38151 RepID=A0A1B6DWX9_9HEMI